MTMRAESEQLYRPARSSLFSLSRVPNWIVTALSVTLMIGLWEYFGRSIDPVLGSYPSAIFESFVRLMQTNRLQTAFWESMQPFFAGYGLAALVGIPLGLLLGRFRLLEAAFGIYVTAGYSMPLIALVPLLILWFGLGFAVKTVIVFLLALFPICINTWLGVKAVPKSLIEVGKAFVAPQRSVLVHIVLPAVLPYIMAGLRLGIGKAVIAMIIAEFLTAISGLGGIIITSANSFKTADMLAPIILIMLFAVVLTAAVGWIERLVAPWQSEIADDGGL
ncbi:MAG TPA: ABC transporter permease [Xanthobacteraceae bacterium]|jgi:NitT/TauT family transport system permease protein|nr:ABC transporter permease [Xanthobacteraceae bacterium]